METIQIIKILFSIIVGITAGSYISSILNKYRRLDKEHMDLCYKIIDLYENYFNDKDRKMLVEAGIMDKAIDGLTNYYGIK